MSIATLHQPHPPNPRVPAGGARRTLRVVGAPESRPELHARPEPTTCRPGPARAVRPSPRNRRRLRREAHTPPTHTPSAHTPSAHTPSAHTPSAHTPSAHTLSASVPPAARHPVGSRQVELSASASSLRLTRRGRLSVTVGSTVVAVAAGVLAAGAWLPGGGATSPSGADVERVAVSTTTVLPGQTLWEIAARVAPEEDRRDTIVRILEVNGLDSARVVAGQQLVLPQGP